MADPLSSLIRPSPGPVLPVLDRLAPPPAENVVAAEIEARTSPGDIVIDLHGRGGWVARAGIDRLRRVFAVESAALTRLVADVVLRPPDLRHFDAAVAALGAHPRGNAALGQALDESFASRCPTCERAVVVDEFIWDGDAAAPSRKTFECSFCRDQGGAGEYRTVAVDAGDIAAARTMRVATADVAMLRARFPVPEEGHPLPDQLLDLYSPRSLAAIAALVTRIDGDLRAAELGAALRLALVHALLPASKLNSYPGRVAAMRVTHGRLRPLPQRQWRERNPWRLFEEGCRQVRAWIGRLGGRAQSGFPPRLTHDLASLIDGSGNLVLATARVGSETEFPALPSRRPILPGLLDARARVRLVLTQPPIRWTADHLSFAYFATSVALGRDAAATLPLDTLFGPPRRSEWGLQATMLRRSLAAARPVIAPDAHVVVMLDRTGPGGLVAGVLGGVGAGFSLSQALLAEAGDEIGGVLEFVTQGSRARSTGPELALHPVEADRPFDLAELESAVSDVAVAVLQARGEPARFERLLGEVLIGLDRLGHLRRLCGTQTFAETEARAAELPDGGRSFGILDGDELRAPDMEATEPNGRTAQLHVPSPRGPDGGVRRLRAPVDESGVPAQLNPRSPAVTPLTGHDDEEASGSTASGDPIPASALSFGEESATDHVRLLMEIVLGELRRPDHRRLAELEPGRWWLRDAEDIAAANLPLADRVEWAVFGLLSTSGRLREAAFYDRIARMFRGHDTPDEELVRACLESYRDPASSPEAVGTADDLQARYREHGELVGMLVDYGHRLGLRCWVSPHEQRRIYQGTPISDLLSEAERRVYLPLVMNGPQEVLEAVDCIWYVRGKAAFLFEVEWTAMFAEPVLRRGRRIPASDTVVRFLVVPPERTELARVKLARSPVLRSAIDAENWHFLKWDHLRRLHASDGAELERLAPLLGLDPQVERDSQQLPLFG